MTDEQTNIFDALGIDPIKPERPKTTPLGPCFTVDGIMLDPIPGYGDGLLADPDGLAVRVVHSHSRKKSNKVGFYAEIVANAMTGKWPALWWVELHAGPAKLYEVGSKELLDGSPLDALNTTKRYNGYVFVEYDKVCAAALRERTRGMPNVHVIEGDCNDPAVHDRIRSIAPTNALTVMYADPEDLDDLDFDTVKFFTERYPHLDWLINFPFAGAVRYLRGDETGTGKRAVRLLAHPNPHELLAGCTGRTYGPTLSTYFQRLLEALGHECRSETIYLDGNNVPYYDLFLATKDKSGRAVDFFEKACGIKANGQRTLFAS